MQVVSPKNFGFELSFVPRFVMIMIVFVALYTSVSKTLFYAVIFGFLYDVIYTDLIGVYMFSMALAGYLICTLAKPLHVNSITGLLFALIAVVLLEFLVYGLYTLVGIADLSIHHFLTTTLYPSLVVNGVFFILIYYPMRLLL